MDWERAHHPFEVERKLRAAVTSVARGRYDLDQLGEIEGREYDFYALAQDMEKLYLAKKVLRSFDNKDGKIQEKIKEYGSRVERIATSFDEDNRLQIDFISAQPKGLSDEDLFDDVSRNVGSFLLMAEEITGKKFLDS